MAENNKIEGSCPKQFEGSRRPDEPSGDWLQRLLFEPFEKFDLQKIQVEIKNAEEQRVSTRAALEQGKNGVQSGLKALNHLLEFYQACLELEAWSSARGPHLHGAAFKDLEDKVLTVHEESEKQERVRQHLVRFAEMVGGALNLLSGALDIFGTEQNPLTTGDSVSQIPAPPITSPAPVVLAANSDDPVDL